MKIIFYHGYGSSKESSKYKYLEKFCKENGYELICDEVDYSSQDALDIYLDRLIDEIESGDEIILVGHSLGGYFAAYLSRVYWLKCLLINPCLFEAERYTNVKLNTFKLERVSTILLADMNDDQLDINLVCDKMETECKVVKVYGDGHRFDENLDLIGSYIKELDNTYNL